MYKSKDRSPLNNAGQQVVAPRDMTSDPKRMIQETQQKIEDLQSELQEKEATIQALQRNYEGISLIYKEEKNKSLEWAEKIQSIERDNQALKSKMQGIENQRLKVVKDLEKAQEELGKFYRSTEEYRACRLENQTNKMLLEKKKKEVEELTRKLEICKGEADALKKVKLDLSATLKKTQSELEVLNKERPELIDEIDRLRYECDNLQLALNKKVVDFEDSLKELSVVKVREQKYFAELSTLKVSFDVEKNELYATRAKLMELYEHYKLLEQQIETKNALLQLADTTERELKEKIRRVEAMLNEKKNALNSFSSSKDQIAQLLHDAQDKISSLQKENEFLRASSQNSNQTSSALLYLLNELEKIIAWYDGEASKLGNKKPLSALPPDLSEKMEKSLQHLSTILTESLLLMKHFDDLQSKYNSLSSSTKSSPADLDEILKLTEKIKIYENSIEEIKKSRNSLHEELDKIKLEKEKFSIELDTARQKIILFEKEIRLKNAMIEQYEQRFNGDPDELLKRIEQLKNELEQFNLLKEESVNSEAKKVLERIDHALETIWVSFTCKGCLERVSRGFVGVSCGHLACENCKVKSDCVECGKVESKVEVSVVEQVASKLGYFKQGLEDLRLNLR